MADKPSALRPLEANTTTPDQIINANFDAASPAMAFGRAPNSAGLTFRLYGARFPVGGALLQLADSSLTIIAVTLSATATNYIEVDQAGSVTTNTSGFTAGRLPLYAVTTVASVVSTYVDYRHPIAMQHFFGSGVYTRTMTDANYTLTQWQDHADVLLFTGGSLSATRDIVLPTRKGRWIVSNQTSGSQSLQVKYATGTGVTIANAKVAIVYGDGTNIVRATADA